MTFGGKQQVEVEHRGAVVAEEVQAAWANPAPEPEEEVESLLRSAARTAMQDPGAPAETLFR